MAATSLPFSDVVDTRAALDAIYGPPSDVARDKAIVRLDRHCRAFVERSPFVLVATADRAGRGDVSPRGGAPGFVRVLDEQWLAIPDAPGNRRVDTMSNIVDSGRAGLLFLVPTMNETLRVNGRAVLSRDPDLLGRLEIGGKPPQVAICVAVEEAFLHCAKAFIRSGLWQPASWQAADGIARPAEIWRDHARMTVELDDLEAYLDDNYANELY